MKLPSWMIVTERDRTALTFRVARWYLPILYMRAAWKLVKTVRVQINITVGHTA